MKPTDIKPLVSAWHPMSDPVDLKHLGKLAEELGELSAAVARCIIQGVGESEPVTGKPNKLWLEEEIADVAANIGLVINRFGLDLDFIDVRSTKKMAQLKTWHDMA
jgi:NTP pyrophosphatase (non-canonical NTP hydrolase)